MRGVLASGGICEFKISRPNSSNEIEQNFNQTYSNIIKQFIPFCLVYEIQRKNFSIEFDFPPNRTKSNWMSLLNLVWLSHIAATANLLEIASLFISVASMTERNRTSSNDWVWLSSIAKRLMLGQSETAHRKYKQLNKHKKHPGRNIQFESINTKFRAKTLWSCFYRIRCHTE